MFELIYQKAPARKHFVWALGFDHLNFPYRPRVDIPVRVKGIAEVMAQVLFGSKADAKQPSKFLRFFDH